MNKMGYAYLGLRVMGIFLLRESGAVPEQRE